MKFPDDFVNKIIHGDALTILKKIPDNSIDCILTSPPYWGCRVYLEENDELKEFEIGLEDHPAEYIEKMVNISLECVRVMKKSGVFFLNLGDVYYTRTHEGGFDLLNKEKNKIYYHRVYVRGKYKEPWLKEKGRLLLPFRIAIELQNRGIIIRDVIIWVKKLTLYPQKESIGTTIPYPVKDRLLSAFEYILQIVKSPRYYFNLELLKTELKDTSLIRFQRSIIETLTGSNPRKKRLAEIEKSRKKLKSVTVGNDESVKTKKELTGANPTNAIMFSKQNQFKAVEGHYAQFPESLAEFFILAGCPEGGIVLDPFIGSGTVGAVAKRLSRNFIGIEINKKYIEKAEKRINQINSLF